MNRATRLPSNFTTKLLTACQPTRHTRLYLRQAINSGGETSDRLPRLKQSTIVKTQLAWFPGSK